MSELFNFCITNNCLPNEWKFAMVTPLYKNKGDLSDFNNYRGISVLSPFAKLFERVIQRQILDYFNSNKLFHESQHGFRSGFSCETALHELISKWRNNLNNGLINLAMFVDFKKAFDYVNSDLLLIKLYCYGFSYDSIKLMANYFTDRRQLVKYKGNLSDSSSILLGVPQGSILGPLFFLIFINDLAFDFVENENLELFADDTTITGTGCSVKDSIINLGDDVNKLLNWSNNNHLSINWSKTFVMFITDKKNIIFPSSINTNDVIIQSTNSFKLLGVYVDSHLSFKDNITYISSNSTLFSLKSILYFI